ncbi:MAG: glycosyl transferase family protein [Magnetospirillum sp.]|nr:glycosyl transferase family protein [Magnetospirillum sp.]
MTQEHPFAQYVRILGKGPNLSRSLTFEEAHAATAMIMAGEVEPVQLGAFLCLMRVKTETPAEVAGLAKAMRESLAKPSNARADIDWAAYAGKSRQLPYYVLAALALAQHGIKVFMHGAEHHTEGRVYTSEALAALGVSACGGMDEVARRLESRNFAYITLEAMSPRLHAIMALKPLLGLRTPLHTIGRLLNPLDAAFAINAATHPPYLAVHQEAAQILGQPFLATFKGEGGEVERRPEKSCDVLFLAHNAPGREEWPALLTRPRAKDETMDLARLKALWTGEAEDEAAAATIAGTMAIALRYSGRAASIDEAEGRALAMWRDRIRSTVPGAA